ncbi:MAG: branched-chain amino acid ABC transporter permease [Nitrososphaerota archaeon]
MVTGSLYALMAYGLTVTLSSIRIYNWAYAEYVTISAYITAVLSTRYLVNIWLCFPIAITSAVVMSILVDELVYKPLSARGSTIIQIMLASIATGLLIRYFIYIFASINNVVIIKAAYASRTIFTYNTLVITDLDVVAILVTLSMMIIFHFILSKTLLGKQIRAMWDNFELARLSGVKVFRVRRFVCILVGIPAGIIGSLWSIYSTVTPTTGWILLLPAFAAVIVGGLVSIPGAVVGGYLLGLGENLIMAIAYRLFNISLAYKPLLMLLIMLLALFVRAEIIPIRFFTSSIHKSIFRRSGCK